MSKKVSQEEIDRQLNALVPKIELDHASSEQLKYPPKPKPISEPKKELKKETTSSGPSTVSRVRPAEVSEESSIGTGLRNFGERNIGFGFLAKTFLLIVCMKSWWILVMWGAPFFFKAWPSWFGFRIQPYLIPNLIGICFLAWQGKANFSKKIRDLQSIKQDTERLEVGMKACEYILFQCPTSLFFATMGLNPFVTEHLGVFVAIFLNLLVGVGIWRFGPRYLRKPEAD